MGYKIRFPQIVISYRIWVLWFFLTLGGFLLSLLVIEVGEAPYLGTLQGIQGGAIIGFFQYWLLRQRLPHAYLWAVASVGAWICLGAIGLGGIGWFVPVEDSIGLRIVYGIFEGVQVGTVLGLAQWLVLRSHIPEAWRWIGISIGSWAISLAVGWTVGGVLRLNTGLFLGEVIGLGVTWGLLGNILGGAIAWLLPSAILPKKSQRRW